MASAAFKHRTLSVSQRENFLALYEQVRCRYRLFQWLCSSQLISNLWVCFMLGLIFIVSPSYALMYSTLSVFSLAILFPLGIFALQVVFVASHMEAHALFLEYDEHKPGSERCGKTPVYYFAFYHHHHLETDNPDDWAPQLSHHNEQGARAIVAAHWMSYTFVWNAHSFAWIALCSWIEPGLIMYFAGYELGGLLLPIAHGWQHLSRKWFNAPVRTLFRILAGIGLVATREEHLSHHIHNHRTVYQDFSSSGLYMKWIDAQLNAFWNRCFDYAAQTNQYVADIIASYCTYAIYFQLLAVPVIIAIASSSVNLS